MARPKKRNSPKGSKPACQGTPNPAAQIAAEEQRLIASIAAREHRIALIDSLVPTLTAAIEKTVALTLSEALGVLL